MSPNDEYAKALEKAVSDLSDRVQRRELLNAEIAGLRETVRVLTSRIPLTQAWQERIAQLLAAVDYATPSLTDSIRGLLARVSPKEMTAIEIRNALEESGFDFEDFSNSLSACHASLKRLLKEDEVEAGKARDGKTTFRAILRIPTLKYNTMADIVWDVLSGESKPLAYEGMPKLPWKPMKK